MVPFTKRGATVTLSTSTTSTNGAVAATGTHLWIVNAGTVVVFIASGFDNTVTATAADLPIPAGQGILIRRGAGGYIAGLAASTTATVYVTPVEVKR